MTENYNLMCPKSILISKCKNLSVRCASLANIYPYELEKTFLLKKSCMCGAACQKVRLKLNTYIIIRPPTLRLIMLMLLNFKPGAKNNYSEGLTP